VERVKKKERRDEPSEQRKKVFDAQRWRGLKNSNMEEMKCHTTHSILTGGNRHTHALSVLYTNQRSKQVYNVVVSGKKKKVAPVIAHVPSSLVSRWE
jgi:hypothetical protein